MMYEVKIMNRTLDFLNEIVAAMVKRARSWGVKYVSSKSDQK